MFQSYRSGYNEFLTLTINIISNCSTLDLRIDPSVVFPTIYYLIGGGSKDFTLPLWVTNNLPACGNITYNTDASKPQYMSFNSPDRILTINTNVDSDHCDNKSLIYIA